MVVALYTSQRLKFRALLGPIHQGGAKLYVCSSFSHKNQICELDRDSAKFFNEYAIVAQNII